MITVAGQVHDQEEIDAISEVARSGKWAEGPKCNEFSRLLANYLGTRRTLLTNSGSSANLLAIAALKSPLLGARRLRDGDRVVTAATSFPTTVAPILQNGLMPVFVDVEVETGNPHPRSVTAALDSSGAKAIILTHTLGNPFDLDYILAECRERKTWLIEDNCDALGAEWREYKTGSLGHFSTQSFYPAHHISCGEGGAVSTQDPKLARVIESLRNWGRDCWCPPGRDGTCGKRFEQQFGDLPFGYDHKYVFTHVGYNLKMTDLQAAAGVAQMRKLDDFVMRRRRNWSYLRSELDGLKDSLIFQDRCEVANPSPFGFLITIKRRGISRAEMVKYLEAHGVMTRALFGGNLVRQPAFKGKGWTIGSLEQSDFMMNNSFWVGCWPGLKLTDLDKIVGEIRAFLE